MLAAVATIALVFSLASQARSRLTRKRLLLGLAVLTPPALGLGVAVALLIATGSTQLPPQPLAFPHTVHAGQLGIACLSCHRGAATDLPAGLPSLEQCLACHRLLGKGNPEVAKLVAAFEKEQPLNWLRLNRLPDHVHFDHAAHYRAGVTCATCHGAVETMKEIKKIRSLEMGDCLSCHRTSSAPTNCSTCHY